MIDSRSCKPVGPGRWPRFAVVLAVAVSLGACSQKIGGDFLNMAPHDHAQRAPTNEQPVQRVAYYSKLYADNPRDKGIALAYADALRENGHKSKSLAILRAAAMHHKNDPEFASVYGRAALDSGQVALATKLLVRADDPGAPDWRVTSARGTALAKQGKYSEALTYFRKAQLLAPSNPTVMNNLAMAQAANGDLKKAEQLLRSAVQMPTAKPKVRRNLALVLRLQGRDVDAGRVAAQSVGQQPAIRQSITPQTLPNGLPSSQVAQAANQ